MAETVAIHFNDESQQSAEVQEAARDAARLLTPNEELQYLAVQNLMALSTARDAAVVTNNRLLFLHRHVFGRIDIEDFQWQDVQDVDIKQGMIASDVIVRTVDGVEHRLPMVHKEQAARLYAIAQQMEQEWREKRRVRTMEEERARAGGIMMSMPGTHDEKPTQDDSVARLAKARTMLDQGLISEPEYDTLKAKILASV